MTPTEIMQIMTMGIALIIGCGALAIALYHQYKNNRKVHH